LFAEKHELYQNSEDKQKLTLSCVKYVCAATLHE